MEYPEVKLASKRGLSEKKKIVVNAWLFLVRF
jgi:hypothetical protein